MTPEELDKIRADYFRLMWHVIDDHGLDRPGGTAGQIEANHIAAHRREHTAWHDVFAERPEQQEVAR